MNGPMWNHRHVDADGISVHYVRHGSGTPLVILHGWPEFWYTWRKIIPVLAERFEVVAPDLRGFGETDKPGPPDPPKKLLDDYVEDLRALADTLGFERFGVVSHDVGAYVAQEFARKYPERLGGLFFFDCPYPGIGKRWADPSSINEIWYFMKPGNLQGGFDWYISTNESRLDLIRNGSPDLPKIETSTRVRWGEYDSVLKVEWADRLGDYFADLDFAPMREAGHFAHYERPDLANREISDFFRAIA